MTVRTPAFILVPIERQMLTYLLPLHSPTDDRPLPGPDDNVVAAFGQSQRLVHSVAGNGRVQVVPMETVGGGSNALHGSVAEAPVLITIVSSRGTGPRQREQNETFISCL